MAIKIRYGNAVIEAETSEDLKAVLSTLGQLNGAGVVSINERVAGLLKRLVGEQVRFLGALRDHPEGITDTAVCEVLRIQRTQLGGILKAISRKATSAGLDSERYLVKRETIRAADGARTYIFRLQPEMKEAMEAAG